MKYLNKSKNEKDRKEIYSEINNSVFKKFFNFLLKNARIKFFKILKKETNYNKNKNLIDIGTTPSLDDVHNTLLSFVKKNKNITCLSNLDCKILLEKYSNIKRVIKGDARKTKLKNNSFDIVHSNATIEHVGSEKNQRLFIKECLRISKQFVFIQTPNRYYPIDFHTLIPIIHWLPKKIHRKILFLLGFKFYSKEKNLNLLSKDNLLEICKKLNIKKYKIVEYKLFFLPSNLILIIKKN